MVQSIFLESRLSHYQNKKPIVIVGNIIDKTNEGINTEIFIKNIERSLLKSNRFALVANQQQRQQLR